MDVYPHPRHAADSPSTATTTAMTATFTATDGDDPGKSPVEALCRDLRRQYGAAAAGGGTTYLPPLTYGVVVDHNDHNNNNYEDGNDISAINTDGTMVWEDSLYADPIAAASVANKTTTASSSFLEAAHATANLCECRRRRQSLEGGGGTGSSSTHSYSSMSRRNSLQRSDTCSHCGGRLPRRPRDHNANLNNNNNGKSLSLHRSHTTGGGGGGGGGTGAAGGMLMTTEEPAHVRHFLQDTPQLRFLRSDLDMNGAEPAFRLFGGLHSHHSSNSNNNNNYPDYRQALREWKRHQRAATELANLLWTLSHEMSLEDYGAVESTVCSRIFALVHTSRSRAGLAALTALWDTAPSADEERRCIKFAYTLSQALRRNGAGDDDFEFLRATATALGRMAQLASNADFVESEVTRALEWLRTERSDRRLAACLALEEFAIHAPTVFYSKTSQSGPYGVSNEFLETIFQAIRDPQPVVRVCAADALSQCLKILADRRVSSLTGLLCQVHFSLMEGLQQDLTHRKRPWQAIAQAEAAQHGSLLVVSTMLAFTGDFVLPRYDEICEAVLAFQNSDKALIRLEVIRLIPRLARRSPHDFGRRYLEDALSFLIHSASTAPGPRVGVDIRPAAFTALGQLVLAMTDDKTGRLIGGADLPTLSMTKDPDNPEKTIVTLCAKGITHEKLQEIFALVRKGLSSVPSSSANMSSSTAAAHHKMLQAQLHCATDLIQALETKALEYMGDLIERMFQAGLSNDLIQCLHSIAEFIPSVKEEIEDRMLEEVSISLAGMRDVYKPLANFRSDSSAQIMINLDNDEATVRSLVLSLQTVASFGGNMGRAGSKTAVVPLLPFIQDVVARYLLHPSNEVRRAAASTCCKLLVSPDGDQGHVIRSQSGLMIENVLETLVRVAVSDAVSLVRLCVVQALDARYDVYLCQAHHLQQVIMLLQDETLAVRATGLRLLGRLASINPALVLPVLRQFLQDLISELRCGVDTGRSREEATRLLVSFLRGKSLQRLIHPVLPSLVSALPLDATSSPRLASASLEALGELALAAGAALQPWIPETVPHVLAIMQDQSSTSKQRTSLRTLGQIAGSTGYVIRPYLDYPRLLSQATDILPATKRAPWSLRREVIRTLGILGALDPDRYYTVASKNRKRGAVGGAYFEDVDIVESDKDSEDPTGAKSKTRMVPRNGTEQNGSFTGGSSALTDDGEELPAYLFMYEQYSTAAVPVSKLPPAKRMTPSDEDFYPSVSIQALMRIFCEPTLAVHHGMVIQAVMFIFKSLGMGCVPYLSKVVPLMISTVRSGQNNLRESILKQLATLSLIVREHLRPYVSDIFDVAEEFWDSRHLATIFDLVSNIAVGVPDEFQKFAPRLIQRLLHTLDQQMGDWAASVSRARPSRGREESNKLRLALSLLNNLRTVLSTYLNIIVPALLKLSDSLATLMAHDDAAPQEAVLIELSVITFRTISNVLETLVTPTDALAASFYTEEKYLAPRNSQNTMPSRIVQPLVRILREKPPKSPTVGIVIIETLCTCASHIGGTNWIKLYDGVVRAAITHWQSTFPFTTPNESIAVSIRNDSRIQACLQRYDEVVDDLLLPPSDRQGVIGVAVRDRSRSDARMGVEIYRSPNDDDAMDLPELSFDRPMSPVLRSSLSVPARQRVNQTALQRAWDVSQRSSRDDWEEWMRRFAIRLLQEAPSPALRATAGLAQAYQPLARELFSAAFACCWKELSDAYRANLVNALETAFVADVSAEILQSLLNLAEFMEHDPEGGLPIDISILADLALKCRAYAKALHYKEREYNQSKSNGCVEALISINRKLDLQDAALGVLKASSLGESLMSDNRVGQEFSTKFARHHALDFCYSVIWDAQEKFHSDGNSQDLTAKQELWLAKLGSWTEALAVYEEKLERDSRDFEAILGCMRCLDASGEWRQVLSLADQNWQALLEPPQTLDNVWRQVSSRSQRKATRLAAEASWRLGRWDDLEKYSSQLLTRDTSDITDTAEVSPAARDASKNQVDFDGAFYTAVLHIHRKDWAPAADAIDAARRAMDGRMTALLAESYSRAYPSMVTAQMLAEMEEIVELRKMEERSESKSNRDSSYSMTSKKAREHLLSVWKNRLEGCRVDAGVHASILGVRSLILGPEDDVDATLTLSEVSRQDQRFKFAERVLVDPLAALGADISGPVFGIGMNQSLGLQVDFARLSENPASLTSYVNKVLAGDLANIVPTITTEHEKLSESLISRAGGLNRLIIQHRLYFALTRHLWFTDRRPEAIMRLSHLSDVVDLISNCEGHAKNPLRVSCFLELGEWKLSSNSGYGQQGTDQIDAEVLTILKRATLVPSCGYRAWHAWALLNYRIAQKRSSGDENTAEDGLASLRNTDRLFRNHVVAAVHGFVNAISVGTRIWSASVQQDLLNLLSCLFKYGSNQDIASSINESIGGIAIEAWLGVLPQLLARIHIREPAVRSVLHPLLTRLGEKHPQALMYPLAVLVKSPVVERKYAAESLMTSLKSHSSELVEEALLVSSELIRVAILWLETWHEGLEDASRLWYGEQNFSGMLELLLPLHEKLERGAETKREIDFLQSFGDDLAKAHAHLQEYVRIATSGGQPIPRGSTNKGGSARMTRQMEEAEIAMDKAWDIYYSVFRRINKQLPSLTKLELAQCSPALSRARRLELGVPGSYRVDGSYVKIDKFVPSVQVITSKQRPRKITLRGSDGKDYVFLLKGHEDLRQDERVMQLFGLVNALLARDPQTKKHDLGIQRYAIAPLSHNCGLVGWVPHCDTLHSLIRDYRINKKVPLNMENREMLKLAPDYEMLTVMQKVEVFSEALQRTTGQGNDLYDILWLKSTNSEEWLDRRTKFTRSLAVMSMVGYILGLGDRHPSNLMLDKISGRVLHIDFGDCFEVAMNRDKFPEKVPFRLTRMLIKAMEVAGIEGSYRSTCERTMTVLRDSRDSLVAMLEAFVYDPLISWGLADLSDENGPGGENRPGETGSSAGVSNNPFQPDNKRNRSTSVLGEESSQLRQVNENESHDGDSTGHLSDADGEDDSVPVGAPRNNHSRARSLQMYANIQTMAANLPSDDRIQSITGGDQQDAASSARIMSSSTRSRMSLRQREVLSLVDGAQHEVALNEKALKVIRRVEEKLTGTDFDNDEPLDVSDQVQRLIVQATNTETLCQLYIGWCAFW